MTAATSTREEEVKGARLGLALRAVAAREAQRLTIWSPICLVAGIWLYFMQSREPSGLLAAALLVFSGFSLWRWRKVAWLMPLVILVLGFCLAKIRTEWVATPLLRAVAHDVVLRGRVADVERRSARRLVVVVEVESATGLEREEVPRRARLQLTGKRDTPRIGDHISGEVVLTPLPLPVAPGAFDYGRALFFESIGATGRFVGDVQVHSENIPARFWSRRAFQEVRQMIGAKVRAVVSGPLGSFADALITGERADIPKEMNESLLRSGLFHILSISGLHMALVVGSAFWVLRAVLALSPSLALRHPIKKWAAGAAMFVGLFYMLLADSGPATERSFIMVAVVLFAVMVDRPALSLHNLAIAALIILVREPEQAIAASFQMSFLAVMGLAAFFEWWSQRTERDVRFNESFASRWFRRTTLAVVASILTSVIAGSLSSIPSAHHFGRIAPYGVIANAMALPIVSVAVMPMGLAAVLLMPFGLEALPLTIMELGLKAVMWISDWVTSWPQAGLSLPLLPAGSAVFLTLAAVCLALLASWWRALAIPFVVASLFHLYTDQLPDVLIDERARGVAARAADGALVPLHSKQSGFAVKRWLQAEGDDASVAAAMKRNLWVCEKSVCKADVKGKAIAFLKESADPVKPCPLADIVIAQYPLRRSCKGRLLTIDRFDVWRNGAYGIFLGSQLTVETVRGAQGSRPWTWQPRPRKKLPSS